MENTQILENSPYYFRDCDVSELCRHIRKLEVTLIKKPIVMVLL